MNRTATASTPAAVRHAPGAWGTVRRAFHPELTLLRTMTPYLGAGLGFGIVLMKSEVVSWYRIQEMFRFQSFHMYGVIGSAVVVAMVSVWLLRRFGVRALDGSEITVSDKDRTWPRYILGGTAFGLGWGLVGACPGPMLALVGAGAATFGVAVIAAIFGTYAYGRVRGRLPH